MIMQSGSPAINMKVLILPIIGCCTFACLHTKPVEYSHSKAQYNGAKCLLNLQSNFQIPYACHHNPLLITNHRTIFFEKNKEMEFKMG